MRYWSILTFSIQACAILLLSLMSVYAFSNSFINPLWQSIFSSQPPIETMHISAILAVILIIVGSLQIIVRRVPKIGFFIFLVAIFLTPSVLATTTIDWVQILGLEFDVEYELPWGIVLLFTTITVFAYIILRLTTRQNSLALVSADRGYDKREVGKVYGAQHIWGFFILCGATIISLVIFLLLKLIDNSMGSGTMSGVILPLGILCSLLLILTVYAVFIRKREPSKPGGQSHSEKEVGVE